MPYLTRAQTLRGGFMCEWFIQWAFNSWPGCAFRPSTPQNIKAFADTLEKAGFAAPVRVPRGQDILAACGQLKSKKDQEGG